MNWKINYNQFKNLVYALIITNIIVFSFQFLFSKTLLEPLQSSINYSFNRLEANKSVEYVMFSNDHIDRKMVIFNVYLDLLEKKEELQSNFNPEKAEDYMKHSMNTIDSKFQYMELGLEKLNEIYSNYNNLNESNKWFAFQLFNLELREIFSIRLAFSNYAGCNIPHFVPFEGKDKNVYSYGQKNFENYIFNYGDYCMDTQMDSIRVFPEDTDNGMLQIYLEDLEGNKLDSLHLQVF